MAKGRMVVRSIAYDPSFNRLSVEAQLLFLRSIPHLDRDGLAPGEPLVLWSLVAPRCAQLRDAVETALEEWQAQGLVMLYESEMGPVVWFTGFANNQSLNYAREGASIYPPPPGYMRGPDGLTLATGVEQTVDSETKGGEIPEPAKPEPLAKQFQRLLDELRDASNKAGKLGDIYQLCYGEPPDYARLGKLAKTVGGAGRLAQLLWMYSADRPAGSVLDYITKVATAQARRNGKTTTNGTEHEQPSPDNDFLARFRAAQNSAI